ncbi:hypothetical protein L7F22_061062 [Adiantum nelumboides]|nr:hypothetical protein [Adiantum nelumboides]
MSNSGLELQDQTPPTNQLVMQSSPSKVEVKVKAVLGTPECVASNSKQSTKSSKALEYPRLSKFCFSAKELHEEYALNLEGKLPKELSNKDIPDEEWLSVFKCLHKKSTKLFLNHVRDEFVDECRLLYQKVYQATPSNGELLEKFARGFVCERCPIAGSDPIGHRIAWARELDQLNKELEVLKNSPNSYPQEVDRKEVEVTAITKMLSKAGATTDLGRLKEDLDSLQVSLLLRVPLEVLGDKFKLLNR